RRRHTRLVSDWSSDVCSSDLDIAANLAKFDVGDRQVPIRVQLEERARGDREVLGSLKVATGSGAAVPLSALARFELSQGPTAIEIGRASCRERGWVSGGGGTV